MSNCLFSLSFIPLSDSGFMMPKAGNTAPIKLLIKAADDPNPVFFLGSKGTLHLSSLYSFE